MQIASKNTLSAIDHQGQNFNTNIAKVKAKNVFFRPLDDIESVDWTSENKFARLWLCEDIHHSSFLNLSIERAIQKPTNANLSSKLFQDDSNKKTLCWVCVFTQKGHTVDILSYSQLVVFHTDLQVNTIVMCILTARNHIMSNMQDHVLQVMQSIQYCHVSSFSTVITNHFIGDVFYLSQHSMDGYEAMGFDVTQSTQDEEQSLFKLKTNMPIPMLVYGDSFQWEKYGHHILPSNLDLTSHNKAGLHQKKWNCLIEFLHTDLDGNLGFTFNPLAASKLNHFLSTLFEGVSDTANQGKMFGMWNEKSKHCLINEMVDIAVFATQIPLSIFTTSIHQRFENHSMLESTLEILQQFYIQMVTEPEDFLLFPGDLSLYTLRCLRCGQHVTIAGSIGEIYYMHPLQCHITGTCFNPMTSKITENQC